MLLVVCQLSSDFNMAMKSRNVIGQLTFHPSILSQLNSRLCSQIVVVQSFSRN